MLMAWAAAACGGEGSSGDGDGEGSSGDGTGTDTGDTVENCAAACPVVALGYESLAWPNSTPFDADVLSVEGDVAQLNASVTSDFSFRWNEPELSMLVSPGEVVAVDMDGNSSSFHHWFQTENRLLIAARYRTGLGEDFTVDRVPASQLEVDIDGGTKVGTCFDELITGEPVYEVFEHAIVFSDGETELSLKAGEAGELDSAVSNRLAMLKVYQALSFQNAICDGPCEGASAYQRLTFSQRVDY
jgi:hypothetical protein